MDVQFDGPAVIEDVQVWMPSLLFQNTLWVTATSLAAERGSHNMGSVKLSVPLDHRHLPYLIQEAHGRVRPPSPEGRRQRAGNVRFGAFRVDWDLLSTNECSIVDVVDLLELDDVCKCCPRAGRHGGGRGPGRGRGRGRGQGGGGEGPAGGPRDDGDADADHHNREPGGDDDQELELAGDERVELAIIQNYEEFAAEEDGVGLDVGCDLDMDALQMLDAYKALSFLRQDADRLPDIVSRIDADLNEDPYAESRVDATLNEELMTSLGGVGQGGPAELEAPLAPPVRVPKLQREAWRAHLTAWSCSVVQTGIALEFAGKAWLQAPRVGVMSLVYRTILEDGNPTRSLDFIHWDDIGQKVGRLVRVEGKLVSYTLPKDKQSFAEDDLEFILANTCLQMVRCKGIFRPEMPDYIFRLKEVHELASGSSGEEHATVCELCDRAVRRSPDGHERPLTCPMCLFSKHETCAVEALACLAEADKKPIQTVLSELISVHGWTPTRVEQVVARHASLTAPPGTFCRWCSVLA